MKIVQGDELEWKRALEYRGGIFHNRILVEGEEGTLDNFQIGIGRMSGEFFSPRHHHNFEQIRFQLEGALDFARDGKMETGMVGYFPEGAYYGPQTQDPDGQPMTVVLQFGGASGSGYISRAEVKAGMDEMQSEGEFKDGVFRRNKDLPGKRNVDGYQAIWEHVNERPMVYPKPRYSRPFMMDPKHYAWIAVEDAPGVTEKLMGVFTERRSEARFLKLDPGSSYRARGRGVYFVIDGSGDVEGQPIRRLTSLYLKKGETANFTARGATTMLFFGLPDLAGIAAQPTTEAVAAE